MLLREKATDEISGLLKAHSSSEDFDTDAGVVLGKLLENGTSEDFSNWSTQAFGGEFTKAISGYWSKYLHRRYVI